MSAIVEVLVPAYNELSRSGEEAFLKRLDYFDELVETHPQLRVAIIDDGSTDGSREILQNYVSGRNAKFRTVYKITNGQKIGAIKDGVSSSEPTNGFFLLTDFDTSLTESSAQNLPYITDQLQEDVGMGAIRVVPRKGNFLTKLQKYDYLMGRGTQAPLRREMKIRCISGAGGLWRRDVLEEVLPLHDGSHASDDFLLTTLAQKNGYKTEYFPQMVVETEAPSAYRDLIKQRKRWDIGAFETYEKELPFFLKEIPKIVRGKLYGLSALLEWASWAATPFGAYIASKAVSSDDYKHLASYYLTDLAVSGALMFLRRKEIEDKKEATMLLPLMPFYRMAVYYPARTWAVASHLKDKINSATSYLVRSQPAKIETT